MTHTTTEVEEIMREFDEQFEPMPDWIVGQVWDKEDVAEFNKARLRIKSAFHHYLTTLHHQLQKAREEERERSQVEVLAAITGLQEALDNAPMTFNQDIDITEVPDGLAHELRGMKKGWHAALEQLKANLNV